MKRKILSYLLIWLFTLFIWWCFGYADAAWSNGNSTEGEVMWDGWWNWSSDWWWNSTTTTTSQSSTQRKCWDACDWIKLNTCFPIIWDCIETKAEATNPTNAFPYMIWALTKIVMSVILVVCFILVIVAWIMRSADKPDQAKKLLKRVAITILLLWFSWVILKLVNPNFFY